MEKKKTLSVLLAAFLLLAAFFPKASAASIPGPGESGYVSLHKYVSKTDIPNVFKVSLQVQGQLDPPIIGVFLMVDQSGSMAANPTDGGVVTPGDSKIKMTTEAVKEALNIFFDPSINAAYENTYIGMAYYTNMKAAWVANARNIGPSHITGMDSADIYSHEAYNNNPAGTFPHYHWVPGGAGYGANAGGVSPWPSGPYTRVAANVPVWDNVMENFWAMQNQTTFPMVNYTEKANLDGFADEILSAGSNWYNPGAPKLSYASSRTEVLPYVYHWLSNPALATGGKAQHFDKVYVIVMSDGTDDGNILSGDSTNFFQAIKGDPTVDYYHQRLSGPQYYAPQTAQQTLIGKGLDGTVMGISLGLASGGTSNMNWDQDLIDNGIGNAAGQVNIEQAGTIYNAAATKDASGVWHDNPGGFLGTTIAVAGANSVESWFNTRANIVLNSSNGIESNYKHAKTKTEIVDAYKQYAQQIVGNIGTNVFVSDKLGSHYTFYNYPGKPSLNPVDALKTSGSGVWSAGTAAISGDAIRWDIPSIPSDGATIVLEYYVELDSNADPDLYYEVNEYAYISYTDSNGNNVQTYFAVPYAKASGETKNEPAPGSSSEGAANPEDTSTGMIPAFAIPYGNPKVHTASVPTTSKTEPGDALQEKATIENENVADAGEEIEIANTATTVSSAIVLLISTVSLAAIGALLIAIKRRIR